MKLTEFNKERRAEDTLLADSNKKVRVMNRFLSTCLLLVSPFLYQQSCLQHTADAGIVKQALLAGGAGTDLGNLSTIRLASVFQSH
jgi:hypothetical protein